MGPLTWRLQGMCVCLFVCLFAGLFIYLFVTSGVTKVTHWSFCFTHACMRRRLSFESRNKNSSRVHGQRGFKAFVAPRRAFTQQECELVICVVSMEP